MNVQIIKVCQIIAFTAGLSTMTLLAGCGQKGNLYLPEEDATAKQPPAATKSPATGENKTTQ